MRGVVKIAVRSVGLKWKLSTTASPEIEIEKSRKGRVVEDG